MNMDSNDVFFLWIWKIFGIVACVLIVSAASCTMYQAAIVDNMVQQGADPIRAGCAFAASSSSLCLTQQP